MTAKIAREHGLSSTESLPVMVAARLAPVDGASGDQAAATEFRALLLRTVAPGERIAVRLPIAWPAAPGSYRLTVDLVMEDVAWFAEKVGAPVGETTVTVSR